MKTSLKIAALVFTLLCLAGCTRIARYWYLSSYDRDISSATQAIESANNDNNNAHRAEAYAKRGNAYSEKARYSRAFKLISTDEYNHLFDLAIKDHDQAIALDPSAEAYYTRGSTYYDRAVLETVVDGRSVGTDAARKAWFAPAAADFKKATEKDGQLFLAWDRLGLSHEATGELDQAISDYTQEMALNPLGKSRLADAYCTRPGSHPKESNSKDPNSKDPNPKDLNPKDPNSKDPIQRDPTEKENPQHAAIADYEKSINLGATADPCSCDPYNPLLALYTDGRRYDQAWALVHQAQNSKKWIAPEALDRLKKESARGN